MHIPWYNHSHLRITRRRMAIFQIPPGHGAVVPAVVGMGVSPKSWGYPNSWLVYFMENPI